MSSYQRPNESQPIKTFHKFLLNLIPKRNPKDTLHQIKTQSGNQTTRN
ncbi:hypothetical protein SDJN02_11154, partial [Cucurbita argyrosperma subsp. argyrosperma]